MGLLRELLYIGLGGFLGAASRYLVSRTAASWLGASFPYGTLLVNFSGSLAIGFFLVWATERAMADYHLRLFVAVGFCGGYTTFSSFSFETLKLFEQGHYWLAASNVLGNNLLALAGALAGIAVARSL
jgi:CrcB protein